MKNWFTNPSYYIQSLFDPIQTHAVYGVHKTEVGEVKQVLKSKGCTKFRVVNATGSLRIVCFKEPTIDEGRTESECYNKRKRTR